MLVKTYAGAVQGIESQTITIEVSVGGTPPADSKNFYFIDRGRFYAGQGYREINRIERHHGFSGENDQGFETIIFLTVYFDLLFHLTPFTKIYNP